MSPFQSPGLGGEAGMKIKVLKREPADYVRETKHDIHKLNRNYR